jgi:hypothetical protein
MLVKIFGEDNATQAALGFGAILALVSLLLVPGLITKARPPMATPLVGAGVGVEGGEAPTRQEPAMPARRSEEEEERAAFAGGMTSGLPYLDEAKEETIERLVEQPLLRIYRELSTGS